MEYRVVDKLTTEDCTLQSLNKMVVLTALAECRLSDKALYLPNLRFVILLEKEKKFLVFFMKVRFSDNFF